MAGIQIRDRAHAGLNHQKSVIIYDQDAAAGNQPLVIFSSSNWTSPSASGQVEHNMFTAKPARFVADRPVQSEVGQRGAGGRDQGIRPAAARHAQEPESREPRQQRRSHDLAAAVEQRSIAHLYDLQVATDQGFTNVVFSSSHLTDVNLREQANKHETSAFPDPRIHPVMRCLPACCRAHHVLLAGRRQDDGADSENGSGLELHHCWHGAASAATTPARRRRHRALCVDFDQRPRRMESRLTRARRAVRNCSMPMQAPRSCQRPSRTLPTTLN